MSDQLCLFKVDSDSRSLSLSETRPEYSINKYSPGKRKAEYFRLSYRQGNKMRHVHIPGGNAKSCLACYRVACLKQMLRRRAKVEEVLAAIADYRAGAIGHVNFTDWR